jgi:hypothetical protein
MKVKKANLHGYHLRKWLTLTEDTLANETGEFADGAVLRKLVLGAVIQNPYAGEFSKNLDKLLKDSDKLGVEFGRRLVELAGKAEIVSYGKGCIVGTSGEYEHGNALLTTTFADPARAAVGGGKSWIPSTGKIGGPGTALDIPLAHKDALYVRSHYDTITIAPPDSPRPDEIVVLFAVATRGRLHARLGGLKAEDVKGQDGLR